ncbi:MAG: hypothetical protein ACI9OJ_003929 [Myxococcota bacterium]|jgi:hypothetical protein
MISLEDLMTMDSAALLKVLLRAHPLEPDALSNTQYLGVDLSLPAPLSKLLWKTFRKTFYLDPGGALRGWNIKMEQTGIDGPARPLTDRHSNAKTFGHYHLRPAESIRFPKRWRGQHFLDYTCAGNLPFDVARFGYCPLVAVNEGDSTLLLGWELFRIGPAFVPLPPLYYALRLEGPLDTLEPIPRP